MDGIVDQISDSPHQAGSIGKYLMGGNPSRLKSLVAATGAGGLDLLLDEAANRSNSLLLDRALTFQAGQNQQVVHQCLQQRRVSLNGFQKLVIHWHGVFGWRVEECFCVAANRRERRLEFMGNVCNEVFSHSFLFAESPLDRERP